MQEEKRTIVYKIGRYELYPEKNPTCYVVGFRIQCVETEQFDYAETRVPLSSISESMSAHNICDLAHAMLENKIKIITERMKKHSPLLDAEFIPPTVRHPEIAATLKEIGDRLAEEPQTIASSIESVPPKDTATSQPI